MKIDFNNFNFFDFKKNAKYTIIGAFILIFVFGICIGKLSKPTDTLVSKEAYEKLKDKNLDIENKNKNIINELDTKKDEVNKAKEYLSLNDKEKQVIDIEIKKVKSTNEEQLNQKIEEEKVKKAEEEAKKKAEEEARKAEEEAKKKAEEEARKKAEEEAKAQKAIEEQAKKDKAKKDFENANCIETAKKYLDYTSFSRSGLIKQLEFEGYNTESAEYSVDSLNIDWNAQCAKVAKKYLEYTSFSRDGLYNQLSFEGFSDEQIQYGLSQVGY